jgi:hypothetical protein
VTTVRITAAACAALGRVRQERGGSEERSGPLTFTIDGGCCEGAAPHLFDDAVITSAALHAGDADGVPVYLQPAMIEPYADADITIDVIEDAMSESMSLETGLGLRFVLRESKAQR